LAKTSASDYASGWSDPSLVGGAARPLLTGGAYLDGVNGLVLGGLSGNFASAPDSAALDITGDIDIRVRVALDDWTPATVNTIVSKWDSGQLQYGLRINVDGKPNLFVSLNGTTETGLTSPTATGFTDGTAHWLRATRDAATGVAVFYTAPDGSAEPSSWTTLDTTVNTSGNIATGTSILRLGDRSNSLQLAGKLYRAIVRDGIGGTVAFDADFSTQTADALAFTESSTNAATVTINTTRYLVGLPNVPIISGNATNTAAANGDGYAPFFVTEDIVVDMYTYEVTTGPASTTTLYLGIYQADENLQPTGTPIGTATSTIAASFTGAVYQQITPVTLTPGWYLLAYNPSANLVTRAWRAAYPAILHTMGATSMLSGFNRGRTAATMPSNPSPWNTRFASSNGFALQFLLRWRPA
jgi:hypothetical protein